MNHKTLIKNWIEKSKTNFGYVTKLDTHLGVDSDNDPRLGENSGESIGDAPFA